MTARRARPRREVIYYRLHAAGHADRWRDVVTAPLTEIRPADQRAVSG